MDGTLERLIKTSSLSKESQDNLLYTCEKKLSNNSYLCVGDIFDIIRRCETLEQELKDVSLVRRKRIFLCLFYQIISRHAEYDFSVYEKLIEDTFFITENRKALIETSSNNSGFVTFMKYVGPLVEELLKLMQERKSYLVLKKYQEIINLLNRHGLPEFLADEEIKEELEKRYDKLSSKSFLYNYKKQINNLSFNGDIDYKPETFVYAKNYYHEAVALQKILHQKMLQYYSENNCLFRQLDENINLYYLGEVLIIAYKYDDIAQMNLVRPGLTLTWQDRDFWAKILDQNAFFESGMQVNCYVDNEENVEQYKLVSARFNQLARYFYRSKVIFAPEEHLEEAFYKALTDNDEYQLDFEKNEKLNAIGFDYTGISNKLMTSDNVFYFKDPRKVDDLNIAKIGDYRTLGQILSHPIGTSRNRCIASIKTAARKKPKKPNLPSKNAEIAYRKDIIFRTKRKPWWND